MKRGKIMKELLALGCQEIKILFNARWVTSLCMSKRPNVLGQDLTEEDNRTKICFNKSETESEIIV